MHQMGINVPASSLLLVIWQKESSRTVRNCIVQTSDSVNSFQVAESQSTVRHLDDIIQDDRIHDVLSLAARLRESSGGVLDDAAIEAVAEATGAPTDYVRVAIKSLDAPKKQTLLDKTRQQIISVDARLRSSVAVASLGLASGLLWTGTQALRSGGQFTASLGVLAIVIAFVTAWNSRDRQSAGLLGLMWGAVHFFSYQLVAGIVGFFPIFHQFEKPWPMIFLFLFGGFFAGVVGFDFWKKAKASFGFRDAAEERQALVQQLMDIQDRLKQEEMRASFLSLDVVGSTRMKTENDALSVEFTFSEYHRYIETIANRHGGRIHSTAGDGVICVFDEPSHGFDAGRAMLGGLFEFNTFRNRLNSSIELRAGLHTGTVSAPGNDASRVDFAHVIDLAAHLQKEAEPGTLAVSKIAATDLPRGLDSVGNDRFSIDGFEAALWRPRSRPSLPPTPEMR
jgi:class 3 adenylate cyclase